MLARGGLDVVIAEEYEHAPRPRLAAAAPRLPRARRDAARAPARTRGGRRRRSGRAARRCTPARGPPPVPAPPTPTCSTRICRTVGGFEPDVRHRVNDMQLLLELVAARPRGGARAQPRQAGARHARRGPRDRRGPLQPGAVRRHPGQRPLAPVDRRRGGGDHATGGGTMSEPSALERIRALCLALPETNERLSHGSPTFFIRDKRTFVMFHDNHHGDGRLAIWCAAPPACSRRSWTPSRRLLQAAVRRPSRLARRPARPGTRLGGDRRHRRGRLPRRGRRYFRRDMSSSS